jgi:hypothetical protein
MKKLSYCLLTIALLVSCRAKHPQVDKIIEDGVEVVINHVEPYSLPGVPSTLKLEENFSIDTEKEEIAKTGITSIESFCLDRDGNIYFMMRDTSENFIYKFDAAGKYVKSFGRKGQGPGEFGFGGMVIIDGEGRVLARDMTQKKCRVFTPDGVYLEDIDLGTYLQIDRLLANKTFFTWDRDDSSGRPVLIDHFRISDAGLRSSREFYTYEFPDMFKAPRYVEEGSAIISGAATETIFIGDSRHGYVIRVFDLSGKLVRKIRKDFRPVPMAEEYKAMFRKNWEQMGAEGVEILKKISFAANLPPFRFLFADDDGRLFVMTNEREGERGYWYDIFTKDGVFVGRFKLDNIQVNEIEGRRYNDLPLGVKTQGDRLYCLREKDSGYIALTVYRMKWN